MAKATRQSDAKGIEPRSATHPVRVIGGSGLSAPENDQRLVTVLGAESAQGTAVAMSLLEGGYKVRAAVKAAKSEAAQTLLNQGADVTVAGVDDEAEIRMLLRGAFAVWALTRLWDEAEGPEGGASTATGLSLVKIAKEEGLTTFLLPCLPRSFSKEAAKQPVWSAALEAGFTTCVGIAVGFYYSNFEGQSSDLPISSSSKGGRLTFHLPLKESDKLPGVDATDLGSVALAILANPQRYHSKLVGFLSTYNHPVSAWLKAVSQLTGKDVVLDTTSGSGSQLATSLADAVKHGFYSDADELVDAQSICKDQLTTWEQWLVKAGWRTKFDEQLAAKTQHLKIEP